VNGFQFSADLKKMLVQTPGNNFIVMDAGGTKIPEDEGKVDLSDWTIDVEPRAEWTQILREVWRLQRDFFYDPNMHGVDWSAVWTQYSALLPRISNRDELNDLIAEMLGELNCGHAYVGGGDMISARDVPIGGLGADLEPTPEGSWRIRKILRGDGWGDEPVSPLAAPLASAKVGDYIVAIDGEPLKPGEDIYAHLVGRAGKEILLSLSEKPKSDGARDVPVRALDDESYLRYLDWVRDRREYVDSVSGGRIGYIHLPDMGIEGLTMWGRMYLPQCRKDALIMDVRYNRGGSVADMILAQLGNKVWALTKGRDDPVGRRFGTAFYGPMDAICNHETGSDGETFSEGFRRLGLGKVFGTRTWGGWVGIYGGRPLVDRGFNTIPQISGWGAFDGKWLIEGPGVYPDVEVVDEPAQIIRGRDPQLDAAIADLTKQLETWPKLAPQPPYPKKPLEIKNLK